jgi:hypothetical protein
MDPLILAQKSRHQSITTNMLHQDPNPASFALANTALHHRGEDSKPAAAVTAAPSNIVIPPSLQAALDQMLIRHQQNVPPSAPH